MVLVTKIISIFFDIIWLLTIVIIESKVEPWILANFIIVEFNYLFWKFGSNCAYIAQREFLFNFHLVQHLCFDSDFTALPDPIITEWQFKAFWSEVLGCLAGIYNGYHISEIVPLKDGTLFGPHKVYEK